MSAFLFESPIDLSNLEILRVRLEHWAATPVDAPPPSGKIGFNSGNLYPEWSDGTEWHAIRPPHLPGVRNGFGLVVDDRLEVETFVGDLEGTADLAVALVDPIGVKISGKAVASVVSVNGGGTGDLVVTALDVDPDEIALANRKIITGDGTGRGIAVDRSSVLISDWGAPDKDIEMSGWQFLNVRYPTLDRHVATREFVYDVLAGVGPKTPCRLATAEALPAYTATAGAATVMTATSNGALYVDGTLVEVNDRILVIYETAGNAKCNGVMVVTQVGSPSQPYILTRASDADADAEVDTGDEYFVVEGSENGGTWWSLQTEEPITVGTTGLTFVQTGGLKTYTAGNGIVVSGTVIHFASSSDYTDGGVFYGDGANSVGQTGGGSLYGVLRMGASNVPEFGTVKLDSDVAVSAVLRTKNGGTGVASWTVGDLVLGGDGEAALDRLAATTSGRALVSKGVGTKPAYEKIALNTAGDVTAGPAGSHIQGVLQTANGGTGRGTFTSRGVVYGNGTGALAVTGAPSSWQLLQASAGAGLNEPAFVTIAGDIQATGALEGAGFFRIAAGAVTFSKMASLTSPSVIGRKTGSGIPEQISWGLDGTVLRRNGTTLDFGAIALDNANATSGLLPTTRGGTGVNAPLVFPTDGGLIPRMRKINLSSGQQSYTITHGYGDMFVGYWVYDQNGRRVEVRADIDSATLVLTFGFVTTKNYHVVLVGHPTGDTWSPV